MQSGGYSPFDQLHNGEIAGEAFFLAKTKMNNFADEVV